MSSFVTEHAVPAQSTENNILRGGIYQHYFSDKEASFKEIKDINDRVKFQDIYIYELHDLYKKIVTEGIEIKQYN